MHRDLPSALGGPRTGVIRTRTRTLVVSATALTVGLVGLAPIARADDLDDQRVRVTRQLEQSRSNLDTSSKALQDAADALARSQSDLAAARSELARTQQQLAAAQRRDDEMAGKLATAQNDLEKARAAVTEAEKAVAAEQATVGRVVREQYQQKTGLIGVGMLLTGESTGQLGTRLQWSTTMFDSTQAEMNRLKESQRQLTEAREKQAAVERQVSADREAAARNLATKAQLEAAARTQTNRVAALVSSNAAAQSAAQKQVAADQGAVSGLQAERDDVEKRISERIAAQRAQEARIAAENAARAVAERKAREAAAAAARAEAARLAAERSAAEKAAAEKQAAEKPAAPAPTVAAPAPKVAAPAPKAAPASQAPVSQAPAPAPKVAVPAPKSIPAPAAPPVDMTASKATENHGFIYPSGSAITSQFGMRLHPVLGYWKLHDGTDFGAGCGTPIIAPYDGVVTEQYFNAGYGNRLIIDHGRVDGRYVTTSMNHAISYSVSPGDRVKRGQVIGKVGTTGYSTGCHLHYMVWLDGELTNPMTWYNG